MALDELNDEDGLYNRNRQWGSKRVFLFQRNSLSFIFIFMENKELGENVCVAMKLKTISWKMGAKSENVKRKYFYFDLEFKKTFVNLKWANVTTHKKGIHRTTLPLHQPQENNTSDSYGLHQIWAFKLIININ